MYEVDCDIDNRDVGTTWLVLSDGTHVEINPWTLVLNALENAEGHEHPISIFVAKKLIGVALWFINNLTV